MTKAKIMLTGVTILAIVGGALAFKAKNFNTQAYCIGANATTITCSTYLTHIDFNGDAGQVKYKLTSGTSCGSKETCDAVGHSFVNND